MKTLKYIVGAFVALLLVVVIVFQAVVGNVAGCITNVAVNGATKLLKSFSPVQLGYLAQIDQIGRELKLPEKDRATAISVAIQESRSRNLRYGDRDSVGLFQQRPGIKNADGTPYWGTLEQILNPDYSIRRFYKELMKIDGREFLTPLQIALKVQRPSEEAYRSPDNFFPGWVSDALAFIRGAVNSPAGSGSVANSVATREQITKSDLCSIDTGILGAIPGFSSSAPGKLQYPTTDKTIDSKFGMRFHPIYRYWKLHNGVDFAVSCGTPVRAAADGVVKDASDQGGYGNYVRIDHGGGIQTGYAHLQQFAPGVRPGTTVKAGQLIALTGTTGTSTGCHLHFQKFVKSKPVDPAPSLKG